MAQKISVLIVDDIDGGEAAETIRFGLDGAQYEIDLSAGHAEGLRTLAAPYIASARKVAGAARRPARTANTTVNRTSPAKIRDWAKEQGIEVNDRGRVPAEIVAQYETANGK
jgi:hypothetical protein